MFFVVNARGTLMLGRPFETPDDARQVAELHFGAAEDAGQVRWLVAPVSGDVPEAW